MELLKQLVSQIKDKEHFSQIQSKLFKLGIERLLNAELSAHVGYPPGEKPITKNVRNGYSEKTMKTSIGDIRIKVPRDRDSTFEPEIVPKHATMTEELEEIIISLFSKGMSNADISDFICDHYSAKYSTSQISVLTNQLLKEIEEWQNLPLNDVYPFIFIDVIHFKVRHEGKVSSHACYVILGINLEGIQDILALYIAQTETASTWATMLDDLKQRGVKDIFFICSDNLTGLQKAVHATFPKAIHQICIVHQVRNSVKFVAPVDRREVVKDLKEIYNALNENDAYEKFNLFNQKWGEKYKAVVDTWERNWEHLVIFLNFPMEIRKIIYTTNIIESFNASLRKLTNNKRVFPHDQAALKSVFFATKNIKKKWKNPRKNWHIILNQLYIYFNDRFN